MKAGDLVKMKVGDLVKITALWEPILGCVGILICVDPFQRESAGKPIHHSVLIKGRILMIKERHMKVLSTQNAARRPSLHSQKSWKKEGA